MKKISREQTQDDCWIYILLLTTLAILLESLKNYTFKIKGVDLSISLFSLPFIYFISNYIAKKYDYKKAIAAIAISGVMFVSFSAIISFAFGERLILSNVSGEFCGYVISQFINLTLYMFLLNNTKMPIFLLYLNYLFSLIVYYMFYTLIYLSIFTLDTYWLGYFITLGIQMIICLPLAIIGKRVKEK